MIVKPLPSAGGQVGWSHRAALLAAATAWRIAEQVPDGVGALPGENVPQNLQGCSSAAVSSLKLL